MLNGIDFGEKILKENQFDLYFQNEGLEGVFSSFLLDKNLISIEEYIEKIRNHKMSEKSSCVDFTKLELIHSLALKMKTEFFENRYYNSKEKKANQLAAIIKDYVMPLKHVGNEKRKNYFEICLVLFENSLLRFSHSHSKIYGQHLLRELENTIIEVIKNDFEFVD